MPGATPLYGLPYPIDGDAARAALRDIPKTLAEQVESTVSALTGTPAPTAWTTFPLTSGWAQGTYGASYRKVAGVLHLRLHALKATWPANNLLGTLPVGFRPVLPTGHAHLFAVSLGHVVRIDTTTGVVAMNTANIGAEGGIFGSTSVPI